MYMIAITEDALFDQIDEIDKPFPFYTIKYAFIYFCLDMIM